METIDDIALQDNTSQRLPCVLVLDGSGSMEGNPISELNQGLKTLEEELKKDDTASQRVQLLVIRLGDDDKATILTDWTDAIDFKAPTVEAYGRTPLGKAMELALEKIKEQKVNYKANQIPYNRPWIFLITDGTPTDEGIWQNTASRCVQAEKDGQVTIFGIGTKEADFDKLKQFSSRPPVKLDGLKFKELFLWLSKSASSASRATPGEEEQLPAVNWGTIEA